MRLNKSSKKIEYSMNSFRSRSEELHGLCVCVNYSDYLDVTMQYNKHIFDSITIVTTQEDVSTRKLCKKYNLNTVITHRLHENGDPFNKGKAINDGYSSVPKTDWICIFDSDIIFPYFKPLLKKLDKNNLYGIPREDIYNDLRKIQFISCPSYAVFNNNGRGKVRGSVIGYCQIFHYKNNSSNYLYSEKFSTAKSSDTFFGRSFGVEKNIYIQNMKCYHIGTPMIDWSGRKSKKFKAIS